MLHRSSHHIGRRTGLAAAALVCACACGGEAAAQEYCVACTSPAAQYRCVIEGAQPHGGQPLQMLCITAMAREGGHATCAVKRGTVFDCDGPVKRVPWAALNAPQPQAAQPPPPPASAPQQPASDPQAPPKTMLDLAKRANEQTAKDMRDANDKMKDNAKSVGDKMGAATKKTWDCMISLFTRCGGE